MGLTAEVVTVIFMALKSIETMPLSQISHCTSYQYPLTLPAFLMRTTGTDTPTLTYTT
jgi:hypothetical protein